MKLLNAINGFFFDIEEDGGNVGWIGASIFYGVCTLGVVMGITFMILNIIG